jgi:hypothetical protein
LGISEKIADYKASLAVYGAPFYRNPFWEAGLVGQVLYLEAEETGNRLTGIGHNFDDPVHDVLCISSRDWESSTALLWVVPSRTAASQHYQHILRKAAQELRVSMKTIQRRSEMKW